MSLFDAPWDPRSDSEEELMYDDVRRKDEKWRVGGDYVRMEEAQLAVLMDLRDELKALREATKNVSVLLERHQAANGLCLQDLVFELRLLTRRMRSKTTPFKKPLPKRAKRK